MKQLRLLLLCLCLLLAVACHKTEEPQDVAPVGPAEPKEPLEPAENGITVESSSLSGQEVGQDQQEMLNWSVSVPRVLLAGQPMNNINSYYENRLDKMSLYAQEELAPLARQRQEVAQQEGKVFAIFSLAEEFAFTRTKGQVISFRRETVEFTGGVHENTRLMGESWLLRQGDCYLLSLADLFPQADARALVLEKVAAQAKTLAQEQPDSLFENYQELIPQVWQEQDFYLTEESLCIVFQQYALGPYTSGTQIFEIPLAQFGQDLMEELRT